MAKIPSYLTWWISNVRSLGWSLGRHQPIRWRESRSTP